MATELEERVAELPELYEAGRKSTATLLQETGLVQRQDNLDVNQMEDILRHKPRLLDLWLKRRKDQRLAGGWGLERVGDDYQVTSYATKDRLVVHDRARAGAEFLVRYVTFIRDFLRRPRERESMR